MAASPDSYKVLLKQGPFPDQVDPWAEAAKYFHQLHNQMIGIMLSQIQDPLLDMGYIAGRETSLQIAENRQPDLFIERQPSKAQPDKLRSDYAEIAEAVRAEPGTVVEFREPEFDRISIRELTTGNLVTVVEVVSPGNKTAYDEITAYQQRRRRLLQQQVDVVEIDLTRSVKRLVQDILADSYPYHVAIHLHDQLAHLIIIGNGERLKRIALPVRQAAIAIELHDIYQRAYRDTSIAGHILNGDAYREDALPFPSLLSEQQRRDLLEKVEVWRAELARLRDSQA